MAFSGTIRNLAIASTLSLTSCGLAGEMTNGQQHVVADCDIKELEPDTLKEQGYNYLDPYYQKFCLALGIPIVAAAHVSDQSMHGAAETVHGMLHADPELAKRLVHMRLRIGLIPLDQTPDQLPEFAALEDPQVDWSVGRAFSSSNLLQPLVAVGEELVGPLACSDLNTGGYQGERPLTHELGHGILDIALTPYEPTGSTKAAIIEAYESAMQQGTYGKSYAMLNYREYWAEGVQDFFDASQAPTTPDGSADGRQSPIRNRETLQALDPTLYDIITSVLSPDNEWRADLTCPSPGP